MPLKFFPGYIPELEKVILAEFKETAQMSTEG